MHSALNLARSLFAAILFSTHAVSFSQSFPAPGWPSTLNPQQPAMDASRGRLMAEEQNLAIQKMELAQIQSRVQRIKQKLAEIYLMPESKTSPRLAEQVTALKKELATLEQDAEITRRIVFMDAQRLETSRRQLNAQDAGIGQKMGGDHRETVEQKNARLLAEVEQRRAEIEMQNQRLMQPADAPPPFLQGVPGETMLPVGIVQEDAELRLCQLLEDKVAQKDYDIAEINLLAAKGLPGTENLDVERALKTLDHWAAWVKRETDRHLYKYQKAPAEFNNSEAYFRILMMVCTLQQDFRVCYNKDPKMRAGPVELVPTDFTFFGNPKDLFVHGVTDGEHEGTCASLPVFYVAIGRRLGYPLKLVECKGHLFVRWEDAKERFNIEGTSRGLNCYPDQEYMEWPWPISKEELATGMYMKSLSPKRELAAFLELRSLCLKQHGREAQHVAVKRYADDLRKKEGVDLDKLNELMRELVKKYSGDGTVGSALLFQTLTNTNSWRAPGNERDTPGKRTFFSTDRFDSQ